MAHLTQHQLNQLFQKFSTVDITFNKHIIGLTKLIPSEIYIKCAATNYSCILNSTSMVGARIIIQVNEFFFEKLSQNNKWVSLRFAFRRADKHFPLTFFIKSKVESFNPFNSAKKNLYLLNLKYSQRPPDDLIELLGSIIEVNTSAKRRKDERISLSQETLKGLRIKSANSVLIIGNQKKNCIIRDISFFGAKIITTGKPAAYKEKELKVIIQFNGDPGNCLLEGRVVHCEAIKARDAFVLMGIHFHENRVPIGYTKILKEYFDKQKTIDAAEEN